MDPADFTRKIVGADIDAATIEGSNLDDAIIDISKIASGYGLPASYSGANEPTTTAGKTALAALGLNVGGSIVLWTHNAKLYRWDSAGSHWTVATDGADITANSIVANSLTAGVITAPYLAAGAVVASKLFVGDTTNLIVDQTFLDNPQVNSAAPYWTISDPLGTVAGFNSGAFSQGKTGAPTSAIWNTANIPAGNTNSFFVYTPPIPIHAGKNYRLRFDAWTNSNKNLAVRIQYFDATGATLSQDNTVVLTPASYSGTAATELETIYTPPTGAASMSVRFLVSGNIPSSVAGTGSWYLGNPRLERQVTGTLIKDGEIDTDHIVVSGLDGSAITAGTITGDRMTANFIDSETFSTIHTSGQPFIEIDGRSHTVSGHQNAPWYRVNDGTYDRVIMGRVQDAWGLWIKDASGNLVIEESTLGTGVVSTGNVVQGSIVGAATANVADGPFGNGTWQTAASLSITLFDNAITYVDATVLLGYAAGPQTWAVRLKVDGTVQQLIETGIPQADVSVGISWSGSLSGSSAGTSHTAVLEWNAPSSVQIDGGTLTAIGLQR